MLLIVLGHLLRAPSSLAALRLAMASCEMTREEFARFLAGAFDLARAYASPGAIIYACKGVGTWPKCSPPAISELRTFEPFRLGQGKRRHGLALSIEA